MKKLNILLCATLLLSIFTFNASAESAASTMESPQLEFNNERSHTVAELVEIQETENNISEYIETLSQGRTVTYNKKLNVQCYQQITEFHCSAASTYEVLNYINNGVSIPTQNEIGKYYGCSQYYGPSTDAICQYINSRITGTQYQYVQVNRSGNGLSHLRSSIEYSINKNRPVICQLKTSTLVGYNSQKNYSHYVVAIGARNGYSPTDSIDNVYYIDSYYTTTAGISSLGEHEISMPALTGAILAHSNGYIVRAV